MNWPGEWIPRDDGLYLSEIKPHSLEKLRRHNYYAGTFSKAMSRKWPQRAYIGFYSGAGLARLAHSGEIVVTSAPAVCTQEVPFMRYMSLALYSRHERGQEFWRTTLESTDPQYGLGI